MASPLSEYVTETGRYPSNAMIWNVAKDVDEKFDPTLLEDVAFGSTQAPKGHYILESMNMNRQGVWSGIAEANQDSPETTRPTTNCFFAGRYWCAGLSSPKSSGKIFYSQLLESMDLVGNCYSQNDPTAEDFNQVLDTDGGVIRIAEIGAIYSIEVLGTGIAVLANNGIWFIRGGESGFKPTDYTVIKVSSDGIFGSQSSVAVGNTLFYWGKEGIYQLNFSELNGLNSENISVRTIRTLYSDIPTVSKKYCQGFYNPAELKVHWVYSSTEITEDQYRFEKDTVLTLDLQLQAFFKYDISELDTNSPKLLGMFKRLQTENSAVQDTVMIGNDNVVIGSDNITAIRIFESSTALSVKGLTLVPNGVGGYQFTYADFNNSEFKDWVTADGVGKDATAYAVPAYTTMEEPSREKKATYVTTHFNRTETGFDSDLVPENPSSCFMQIQWNWADSTAGNLYGSSQQVYRFNRVYVPTSPSDNFDYGQSVITTRTKVRGNGRSFTLRFSSEEGKDFQLLGWTTNLSVRI